MSWPTLLDDLAERGLLEDTLVITLAEFGRTPEINPSLGRDHFATAWSADPLGRGGQGRLGLRQDRRQRPRRWSTARSGPASCSPRSIRRLGIDHEKAYLVGSRPVPLTDPGTEPVREVLA